MRKLEWLAALPAAKIAWMFFKIGLVFFGGGYVLIPLIREELVIRQHLITHQEFLDGTAISQLTPGPLAVIATFAGYKIGGVIGAIVGTIAVFTPGTLLMLFLSHGYSRFGNQESVKKVLNTLIPAIAGLLLAASWMIGHDSVRHLPGLVIFAVSLVALARYRINPALMIGAAALAGVALKL